MIAKLLGILRGALAGSWMIYAVGVLIAGMVATRVVQCSMIKASDAKLGEERAKSASLGDQLGAEKSARAESERRLLAQEPIIRDANDRASAAAVSAASASAAAGRLFDQYTTALRRARATRARAASAPGSAPASDPGFLSPRLFEQLVGAARRVGDRAVDLANEADRRGIAGDACVRAYESLQPSP